jgi:hypothetical protein
MFRPAHLTALLLLSAPAAFAQPDPNAPPPMPPAHAQGPNARIPLRVRFENANTTRDGRLTAEQAQAGGLRGIARHFAEIDADHKGYVTLQDIRTWQRAMHAARLNGGQGAMPPPGAEPPPPPPQ